ncbi:MAG: alpha/beta hydrolase [Pseudomonadota bacterium]
MKWTPGRLQMIEIGGVRLEALCHGPRPDEAKTLVLLHEGLGSVALWRGFPQRLSAATGFGVFLWSRAGYGGSGPCAMPRPLDYMRIEGEEILPQVLDVAGVRSGYLLGHSDGASIAMHYLGAHEDHRITGTILIAPHFFVESQALAAIAKARRAYEEGTLKARLAGYHSNADTAFYGWNDAWLDPGFAHWDITETIAYPRVPLLAIQGSDDPYGTRAQVDVIGEEAYCPVEIALLDGLGHAPHLEAEDAVVERIAAYISRVDRLEAFGADPRQAPSLPV